MAEKKNVRIRLFKDNSRYKGDLFVSVNGVNYKIRRGVEVEVPPEVAEVLEHSQQQDEYTAARTRQRWLCEVDGMLREKFFRPSSADSREGVGADIAWDNGLRDDDVLLVPPPFDSLYPHYLCAMTDAALGENDRYAGEQAQYNSILAELAAWLRRKNLPTRGCSWRW